MSKKITPNWLDRTIAYFAPVHGNRRFSARIKNELALMATRGYDGAAITRRTKNWRAGSGSANNETRAALVTLRNRARDLVRNESYAQRAVTSLESNIIGAGIIASPKARTEGRASKFKDIWLAWAEGTDCDFDGRNNFYGLQALVTRTMVEAGEVLVRKILRPSSENLPVPMQLQVLEPDFLDITKDGTALSDGGFIIQGVEYGPNFKRRAYHLWTVHPGEGFISYKQKLESVRVPADEILHLYRVDRPGQVRGVTWFAPIMVRMKDHSDWSDATLLRQKLSACFTAFVTQPEGMDPLPVKNDGTEEPALGEALEPGIIEVLRQGQSIEFANPPAAADFSSFSREQLRAMASGIGITYETLTNDYSQVNFSSGRMGWIEFQRNIDKWRWQLIVPHFCAPAWKWFAEAAMVAGYGADPVFASWTPPRREMIDPSKEIEATKTAVRAGLTSLSEAIRQNGYEPNEVLGELANDMKLVDSLGLKLDTDPRVDIEIKKASSNFDASKPTE